MGLKNFWSLIDLHWLKALSGPGSYTYLKVPAPCLNTFYRHLEGSAVAFLTVNDHEFTQLLCRRRKTSFLVPLFWQVSFGTRDIYLFRIEIEKVADT